MNEILKQLEESTIDVLIQNWLYSTMSFDVESDDACAVLANVESAERKFLDIYKRVMSAKRFDEKALYAAQVTAARWFYRDVAIA